MRASASRPLMLKDLLARFPVPDELHAPLAEDAPIPFQPDGVGRMVLDPREVLIREPRGQHVDLVRDRLKGASAALLATGAVVIAFGEKRFDQCLTHVGGLGLVDLDTHAVADRHRAGGDHAAIDVDHTCPARAKVRVVFQITQGGDVHTRLGGDIDFGRIRA